MAITPRISSTRRHRNRQLSRGPELFQTLEPRTYFTALPYWSVALVDKSLHRGVTTSHPSASICVRKSVVQAATWADALQAAVTLTCKSGVSSWQPELSEDTGSALAGSESPLSSIVGAGKQVIAVDDSGHDGDYNDAYARVNVQELDLLEVAVLSSGALNSPSSPATFKITRDGPLSNSLTVQFTLSGSALQGRDYDSLPKDGTGKNIVTFAAGQSEQTVTITPKGTPGHNHFQSVILKLQKSNDCPSTRPPAYLLAADVTPPTQPDEQPPETQKSAELTIVNATTRASNTIPDDMMKKALKDWGNDLFSVRQAASDRIVKEALKNTDPFKVNKDAIAQLKAILDDPKTTDPEVQGNLTGAMERIANFDTTPIDVTAVFGPLPLVGDPNVLPVPLKGIPANHKDLIIRLTPTDATVFKNSTEQEVAADDLTAGAKDVDILTLLPGTTPVLVEIVEITKDKETVVSKYMIVLRLNPPPETP